MIYQTLWVKQLGLVFTSILILSLGACSLGESKTEQTPSQTPTVQPPSDTIYGPGFAFDSLANTRIGGPFGTVAAYRIKATSGGMLESLKIYVVTGSGYSAGNGGLIKISLQSDDGSAAHNPSGTVLATALLTNPFEESFPVLSFDTPVRLNSDTFYHLVFTNLDDNPEQNYVSINSMYYAQVDSPRQPALADDSWDVLIGTSPDGGNRQASTWQLRDLYKNRVYTPILELQYTNGDKEGMGYMEVWVNNPKPISGGEGVRQTFTLSNENKEVTALAIRVRREYGNDPLHIHISEKGGAILAQANIPANEISQDSPRWAQAAFSDLEMEEGAQCLHRCIKICNRALLGGMEKHWQFTTGNQRIHRIEMSNVDLRIAHTYSIQRGTQLDGNYVIVR